MAGKPRHLKDGVALVLVALTLAASACGADGRDVAPAATAQPTASVPTTVAAATVSPVAARLTLDALSNAEYPDPTLNQRLRFSDGAYAGPQGVRATLRLDLVAHGDLNDDGREDAALIIVTETGGSGRFVGLVAAVNQNGVPNAVAAVALGDRVNVRSVALQSGVISLDMLTHPPVDSLLWQGLCCPNVPAVARFRLSGSSLVKVD